jgi:hypothetical protein
MPKPQKYEDPMRTIKDKLFEAFSKEDPLEQDYALTEVLAEYFEMALSKGYTVGFNDANLKNMKNADSIKVELVAWLESEYQKSKAFIEALHDNITAIRAGNPDNIPLRPEAYYMAILSIREPEFQSLLRIKQYVTVKLGRSVSDAS